MSIETRSRLSAPDPALAAEEEGSLLDVAAVLLRRWKLIATTALVATLLAIGLALLLPRSWTAEVVLVPSATGNNDSRFQMLAAQLPGLARLAGSGVGSSNAAVVAAIVKSRAVRDSVAQSVAAAGHAPSRRDLVRLLKRGTRAETDPLTRAVTIDVTARDPRLAQRLAAQFPLAVNAIAGGIATQAAQHKAEALERQLAIARGHLAASQRALLTYEERTGTPVIGEQARQAIAAAAGLQQAITQQEIEIARLQRMTTPDNPQYQSAVAQLETLRGQLRRLSSQGSEAFLPKGALPEVQVELASRMGEFTKDQQIYLSLTADLVDTQFDLKDDLEVVSVLDAPQVPERPSAPHRGLMAMLGLFMGGMLGLFLALVADHIERRRQISPDERFFVEWDRLKGTVSGLLPGGRNGRHGSSPAVDRGDASRAAQRLGPPAT